MFQDGDFLEKTWILCIIFFGTPGIGLTFDNYSDTELGKSQSKSELSYLDHLESTNQWQSKFLILT